MKPTPEQQAAIKAEFYQFIHEVYEVIPFSEPCEYCGAQKGEQCVAKTGETTRYTHSPRNYLTRPARAAAIRKHEIFCEDMYRQQGR
jgi:hypothetical protein